MDLPILTAIEARREAERIRYAKMAASGLKGCRTWSARNVQLRNEQLRGALRG